MIYQGIQEHLPELNGTFSRGSDATYFDSAGILRTAGPNVLRLDHDPLTGKALGARLEGEKTNHLPLSNQFEAWTLQSGAPVRDPAAAIGPDGTLSACRIELPVGAMFYRSVGPASVGGSGTALSPSVFIKKINNDRLRLDNPQGSGGSWIVDLSLLDERWERIHAGHPAVTVASAWVAGSANAGMRFNGVSGNEAKFYAYLAQQETAFVTSPIMTGAAATARLAESLTIARTAPQEGTVVIEGRTPGGVSPISQCLWQWDDGTDANRYRLVRVNDGNLRAIMSVAGVDVVNLDLGSVANDADLKVVPSWRAGQFAASLNGAAAVVDTAYTGPLPVVSTVRCGSGATSGDEWFGTIARLGIFDRAYSPAELPEVWA